MKKQKKCRITVNLRDFGAKGNGIDHETLTINAAIQACKKAGGGQVVFPPGIYLTSSVHLQSNVHLHLSAGAEITGCSNPETYDSSIKAPADPKAVDPSRWNRALILGVGIKNISITGSGTINGNRVFDPKGEEKQRGPHTIILRDCSNVVIRDITVRDSANYAIFFQGGKNIEVNNVTVVGGWDGVHFRPGEKGKQGRFLTVAGCRLYTGDDAIAGAGWNDVQISGCTLNSSCNAVRIIGPMVRFTVTDCHIFGPGREPHITRNKNNSLSGFNLQPGGWGDFPGLLTDVVISRCTMVNIGTAFFFCLKRQSNQGDNIQVSDIVASGITHTACSVESWDGTLFGKVTFRNITIEYAEKMTSCKEDIDQIDVPHVDSRLLPVWGFFGHNINHLTLENVNLISLVAETRPPVFLKNIDTLTLDQVRLSGSGKYPHPIYENVGKTICPIMLKTPESYFGADNL